MKKPAILLASLIGCGAMFMLFRKDVAATDAPHAVVSTVKRSAVPETHSAAAADTPHRVAVKRDRENGMEVATKDELRATDVEKPVATVVTLPNGREMRVLKRTSANRTPEAMDNVERPAAAEMPPAIRLSENFKLPAVVLALSEGALAERSPQVRQAARNVEDLFYRELAEELAEEGGWQEKLQPDPETGEPTLLVEQSPATERVRSRANERFRLLFGDLKYNAYSLRTAVERMETTKGENSH